MAIAVTWALPSQAALDSPVSVRLVAPGGTSLGDPPIDEAAIVHTSLGLSAGDAGNEIGGFWMLDTEFIRFDGDSILLRVRAGDEFGGDGDDLITGYLGDASGHARYEFSGLNVAGASIVGLTAYSFDGFATTGAPEDSGLVDTNGAANPTGFHAQLVGSHQVDFWLDDLVFKDRGTGTGDAFAEFRVDLATQPVPEPASGVLMLLGLAGTAGLLRARRGVD